MAVYLAPTFGAGYQAFDTSGLPLNGGFISTFAAGTATPLATWTTSTGTVANPTSITLGTDGRPPNEIWLTAATTYLFQLFTSSGVSIKSYDNLQGINDPVGIADLPLAGGAMTGPITFSTNQPLAVALFTGICEGRLTLTSGIPVTTADVTGAGTVFFTPYKGNRIALFDGTSSWNLISFTEQSIAVPAATTLPHDVWGVGTSSLTLELTAWTNATVRATATTTQNGVIVKSGATTRRYLGTICTSSVANTTEDSSTSRCVWNYYNRIERPLAGAYSANRTDANVFPHETSTEIRFNAVIGIVEDAVTLSMNVIAQCNGTANLNSTIVIDASSPQDMTETVTVVNINSNYILASTANVILGTPGFHFYTLENGTSASTATYIGSAAGSARCTIKGLIKG